MSYLNIEHLTRFAALIACVALVACGGSDDAPPPSDGGIALTDAATTTSAANASALIAADAAAVATAAANPALPAAQRAHDALAVALRILAQSDTVQRLHPGAGTAPARPASIPMPPGALLSACISATGTAIIDATVNCTYTGPAGEAVRINGTLRIGPGTVDVRLTTQVIDGNTTVTSSIEVVLTLGAASLDGRVTIAANVRRNGVDAGAEQSVRFENIAWDGCANSRPRAGALEVRQTAFAGANRVSLWVRVTYGPACGQVAVRIGGN